jgi:rhomboid protease GluP
MIRSEDLHAGSFLVRLWPSIGGPMTRADSFIEEQSRALLDADERVEDTAYLVTHLDGGIASALSAHAYFAILTHRRLLLIKTRVGAFRPLLENHGVESIDRSALVGARVTPWYEGGAFELWLSDGRTLSFQADRSAKHVSGQPAFLKTMSELYPFTGAAVPAAGTAGGIVSPDAPRPAAVAVLLAVNLAVFVAMIASGVHVLTPEIGDLLTWGASYPPRVVAGEWWRLWTANYVHIGVIHIAFNMAILWRAGSLTERMLGRPAFLVLYTASGLAGSVASSFWSPYVVSAGASGAIFGVYGGLICVLQVRHVSIPAASKQGLLRDAAIFVGYNLLYGLGQEGIDMAAHLGGLTAGVGLGLALTLRTGASLAPVGPGRVLLAAAAALALVLGSAGLLPRGLVDIQGELERFAATETQVLDAFRVAANKAEQGVIQDSELLLLLDRDVIEPWRGAQRRLEGADVSAAPTRLRATWTGLTKYVELRAQAWRILRDALAEGDAEKTQSFVAKMEEAERAAQALSTQARAE